MKRYFKIIPKFKESNTNDSFPVVGTNQKEAHDVPSTSNPQFQNEQVQSHDNDEWEHLESDPRKRKPISEFHPNFQDSVQRAYLLRGATQPRKDEYTTTLFNQKPRSFLQSWYNQNLSWLEYSEENDSVHCLPCYLFKNESDSGKDSFVGKRGFKYWNKKCRLKIHVGGPNSHHDIVVKKCEALMNQKQSIEASIKKQSDKKKNNYLVRLKASLTAAKYLLRGGLAFRAHDESDDSSYKGNFLELIEVLGLNNEETGKVVLKKAPKNHKMTSPDIQKELVNACTVETVNKIVNEIGDNTFSVLVDESSNSAGKEHMAVVARYIDDKGFVVERFIGIVHVKETSAISLKNSLETLLSGFKLSMSKIRGQCYDGASNMRGRFGGLKALIQQDNPNAYYVHCFAHQLQLALIVVGREHPGVKWFFGVVTRVVNVIKSSNKRQDLREHQASHVENLIEGGFLETGRGLNQEMSLSRAGDTGWESHYKTLNSLMNLFTPVIEVLQELEIDASSDKDGEAKTLLIMMQTFDFIFMFHLMGDVLGVRNDLCVALQRVDQDILNALDLVSISKQRLQEMRTNGWEEFLDKVVSSCKNLNVNIPDMEAQYVKQLRSKRLAPIVSNLHHYKFDCFMNILDVQLKELNDRFNMENTELLKCVASLSPCSSFETFDTQKWLKMYPNEFSDVDDQTLTNQFECYIRSVRGDDRFLDLKGLAQLCRTLVQTKKHICYNWIFELVKLALLLPVATASVVRVFSAMKYVKNELRNRMGDPWLNDCLVTYVERDVFTTISDKTIIKRF